MTRLAASVKRPCRHLPLPPRQRGVVSIEYALLLWLGVLPLLWLTVSGVMVMAARQSLTLAASEGARAALRYQPNYAARRDGAEAVARERMQWLFHFGAVSGAGDGNAAHVDASEAPIPCPSDTAIRCITVATSYDYNKKPFLPWTPWTSSDLLTATATIQLPDDGGSAPLP